MAYFRYMSTLVGGTFAHMGGIRSMDTQFANRTVKLFSVSYETGGINSFSVTNRGVVTAEDQLTVGAGGSVFGMNTTHITNAAGQDFLLTCLPYGGGVGLYRLSNDGSITQVNPWFDYAGYLGHLDAAEVVTVGTTSYLFSTIEGSVGFGTVRLNGNMRLSDLNANSAQTELEGVENQALVSVSRGGNEYLIYMSGVDDTITSYLVGNDGSTTVVDVFTPQDGMGYSNPHLMETVITGGTTFVLVGSAGTNSITVLQVNTNGTFTEMDFAQDDQSTRFFGVTALETFNYRGRAFVLAGGSDDGMTLFELNPNGSLSVMNTLVDTANMTLENVQSITAYARKAFINIFVSGEGQEGVTQFKLFMKDIGKVFHGTSAREKLAGSKKSDVLYGYDGNDTLIAKGGNDRIFDGAGKDKIRGGGGADVFVMEADGDFDRVLDFALGTDRIDFSDFDMIYSYDALTFIPRTTGVTIRYQDEVLFLRSSNQTSLSFEDFSQDDFIFS